MEELEFDTQLEGLHLVDNSIIPKPPPQGGPSMATFGDHFGSDRVIGDNSKVIGDHSRIIGDNSRVNGDSTKVSSVVQLSDNQHKRVLYPVPEPTDLGTHQQPPYLPHTDLTMWG